MTVLEKWRVGDAGFTVFGPNKGKISPEVIASVKKKSYARLIALAPEMLEALLDALPYVEDALDSDAFKPGIVKKHADKIRTLIEKAE